MPKYTIGMDYGTLSGRAVLVEIGTGKELATSEYEYPHGVMDTCLPDGTPLGSDWALQHPQDYLDVMTETIPKILKESDVDPADVIGIGIDCTASTVMPVRQDGTPLCLLDEYRKRPHAYVKLWKHHAAQDKATRISRIAEERQETWLQRYGGKVSSEWSFPKLWQVLDEAPDLFEAMDHWMEAADWIVWMLSGVRSRNSCAAGYKTLYCKRSGYPDTDFFKALDIRLENVVEDKLGTTITPLGARVGGLTREMAQKTGLCEGIAIAAGNVDAHVCVPAVGIDGPGTLLAIMGTSTCHMILGTEEKPVPGMCGTVEDGILPGYFGYEAGQTCVGDHFAWFVDNGLPASYREAARSAELSIHAYLREKAAMQKPGESGLLALDWWNGNRSVLVDADLTGLLLGMTLQTWPEDIYRALIEATAYGTRLIVENFRDSGIPIESFIASGGISQKDPLMMQIYSDVLNMPIRIAGSTQAPALGSAIFAAVAAGRERGGYDDVFAAARDMGSVRDTDYKPVPENVRAYDILYREYKTLHDYFGRGDNDVMKRLKQLKIGQTDS